MASYNIVLTIAGSDSGGCAGVQADLKTFSALGVFGTSVISAITAQNTQGVHAIMPIPTEIVRKQIKAVLEDFDIKAIKIGMLYSKENVFALSDIYKIENKNIPIILDPVMISTSGDNLILDETIEAIKEHLFPIVNILTPNLNEASVLLEKKISTLNDMIEASKEFVERYNLKSVLIKGGHLQGDEMTDVFFSKELRTEPILFTSQRIETKNSHGTGCTLSSAIAAFIAMGNNLEESITKAKDYISKALYYGKGISLGKGKGGVNHFFNPQKLIIKI